MTSLSSATLTSSPRRLQVEVVSDLAAFERLSSEWDQLLEDSAQHVYFLRHHWNVSWWRQCAPRGSRPHILCCRDADGRLMGVAPLYWRQHRILGIPCARVLSFIGMGIELKTSEYMDIIARRGHEPQVTDALAHFLKRRRDWDRICLQQVPTDSVTMPRFIDALGARAREIATDRAPYIDTSIGWTTYKHQLGRSMRRNVEYYARRLFKRYPCEFRRVDSASELDVSIKALVKLHQIRWQSSGQPGAFSDTGLESLLTSVARYSTAQGQLRLWTVRIHGEIAAVLLGFLDNGVLHYFQKGFDPAFAKDDLGTAMLSLSIRDCFDDPTIRAFDFMGGGAAYKDLWAHSARATSSYELARSSVRGQLHAARETLVNASRVAFRTLAPMSLRAARRDYLQSVRMRRHQNSQRQRLLHVILPLVYSASEVCVPLFGWSFCREALSI